MTIIKKAKILAHLSQGRISWKLRDMFLLGSRLSQIYHALRSLIPSDNRSHLFLCEFPIKKNSILLPLTVLINLSLISPAISGGAGGGYGPVPAGKGSTGGGGGGGGGAGSNGGGGNSLTNFPGGGGGGGNNSTFPPSGQDGGKGGDGALFSDSSPYAGGGSGGFSNGAGGDGSKGSGGGGAAANFSPGGDGGASTGAGPGGNGVSAVAGGGAGGGGGGATSPGGNGGNGGNGSNNGPSSGGSGGGGGGNTTVISSPTTIISSPIKGGNGGNGGSLNAPGCNGGGGGGGDGAVLTTSPVTVSASITGGSGGTGGTAANGYGSCGGGGAGVISSVAITLTNSSTITGGAGGHGPYIAPGGGGAGVVFTVPGSSITNTGTIVGGSVSNIYIAGGYAGGAAYGEGSSGVAGEDGSAGYSGAGIVGPAGGNTTVINSGSIAGGLFGSSSTRAKAVFLPGGSNTVELRSGYSFAGNVVTSGANNIFALGGTSNASFDLSDIGSVYQGFAKANKNGASTWTVTNSSTLPWTLYVGILSVSSNSALGSAGTEILTFNGGTLFTSAAITSSRPVSLVGAGVVDTSTFSSTFSGVISGSGTFSKQGSGTLTLSGNNSYSSSTTVNAGTLALTGSGSIASSSGITLANVASAKFDISGVTASTIIKALTGGGTTGGNVALGSKGLTISGTSSTIYGGVISGTGTVTKSGSGTQTLTGVNTYTGATSITGGTLALSGTGSIASSASLTLSNIAGAIFNISAATSGATIASLSGGGTTGGNVTLGSKTLTAGNTANVSYAGVIGGTGAVIKQGSGTQTLTGVNTYSGATTINAGTLALSGTGSIASSSGITLANIAGAIFNISATTSGATISSLSGGGTTGGNVTLGSKTLTTGNTANVSYAGVIGGTGAVIKQGSGTQTLTGVNTYSGGTTLNAGALAIADYRSLGSGALTFGTAGATFKLGGAMAGIIPNALVFATDGTIDLNGNSATSSGALSGSAALTLTNSGVGTSILTYQGANTYTGLMTINSGAQLTVNSALNNWIGNLINNGILWFTYNSSPANATYSGDISGIGQVIQSKNNLFLAGTLTYTGSTTADVSSLIITGSGFQGNAGTYSNVLISNNGTVDIVNATAATQKIGDLTNSGAAQFGLGNNTLEFGTSNNATYGGTINNTSNINPSLPGANGNIVKRGTGIATLSGVNTYSGTTTVSAGTLALSGSGSIANTSLVDLAASTIFSINAISAASTTVGALNGSGAVTLGGKGLTFGTVANTALSGNITGTAGSSLTKQGSGTQTLTGTGSSVPTVAVSAGALILNQASGVFTAATAFNNNAATTIAATTSLSTGTFTQGSGGTLTLDYSKTSPSVAATNMNLAGTLALNNFSSGSVPAAASGLTQKTIMTSTNTISGDFTSTQSGATSVDYILSATTKSADQKSYLAGLILTWNTSLDAANGTFTVNTADTNPIFTADTVLANKTGPFVSGWAGNTLTKAGTGTLTLSSINTYTGATTVSAGTLALSGSGSISTSSGISLVNAAGANFDISATTSGATILGLSGGGATGGNVVLGGKSLTIDQAASLTYAGIISGTGTLTKLGLGILTLSGANTFTGQGGGTITGGTTVGGGAISLTSGGVLANGLRIGLSGTTGSIIVDGGEIDDSAVNAETWVGYVNDVSGGGTMTVNNGSVAAFNLLRIAHWKGKGTVNVTGGSLSANDIQVGNDALATGILNITGGSVTVSGTTNIGNTSSSGSATGTVTVSTGSLTSPTIKLSSNGPGTLNIGGASGNAAAPGTISGNIVFGTGTGNLNFNHTDNNYTFGSAISGGSTGRVNVLAGTTIFTAENSYTGATTISAGTLAMGAGGALVGNSGAYSNLSIAALAAFDMSTATSASTVGDLSGAGSVNLGTQGLTFGTATASTTFSGATTATAGSLTKQGAGTAVLSGTNLHTGSTTINAGTLALSGSGSVAASSGVTLADAASTNFDISATTSGATVAGLSGGGATGGNVALGAKTLTVGSVADASYAGVIGGTGAVIKQGSGIQTLTGVNTYTGGTTVNAGILQQGIANAISGVLASGTGSSNNFDLNGFASTLTGLTGGNATNGVVTSAAVAALNVGNSITDYSYGGAISGAVALTKTGSNKQTLTGGNSYTGGTTISSGTFALSGAGALASTGAIANNGTFDISGVTASATVGDYSGTGTTALGAKELIFGGAAGKTLGGNITGATGIFTKQGAGTQTLSGTASSVGTVNVNAGEIKLSQASGAFTATTYNNTATTTVDPSARLVATTFNQGAGGILAVDFGSSLTPVTVTNATIDGTLNVSSFTLGTLPDNTTFATKTLFSSVNLIVGNFTVPADIGSSADYLVGSIYKSSDSRSYLASLKLTWNADTTISNGVFTTGSDFTVGTVLADQTASGTTGWDGKTLTKDGSATLTLTQANTYSGPTTIQQGTVSISSVSNISAGNVEFNDAGTPANNPTLAVTNTAALANAMTFTTNGLISASADTTLSGQLTGAGILTKTGTGVATISNTGNAHGGTTVNVGTVQFTTAANLGAAVTANGGTLQLSNTAAAPVTLTGIAVSASSTIANDSAQDLTLSAITGTGDITKTGTGKVIFAGVTTNSGTKTISQGTAQVNGYQALGTGAVNLATATTLAMGNAMTGANPLANDIALTGAATLDTGGVASYLSGSVTGSPLTIQGSGGAVILTNTTSMPSSTTVSSGTLAIANATGATSPVTVSSGATYDVSLATNPTLANVTANSGSNVNLGDQNLGLASGTMTFNILDGGLSGSTGGGLTKTGTGSATLSGTNTYTGGVALQEGTVVVGSSTALGNGGTVTLGTAGTAGTLQMGGAYTVTNPVSLSTAQTSTIDLNGNATTLSGDLTGGGSILALTNSVAAPRTLTVSGAGNTYSGTTSIGNNVTLALIGSGSIGASTPAFVAANSTFNIAGITNSTYTIGDLSGTTGAVVLGGKNLTFGTATATSFAGLISGTAGSSLTKQDTGKVTLSNAGNNFTDGIAINAGTIGIGGTGVLGTGSVNFNGGKMQFAGAYTVANPLILTSATTVDANANSAILSGNISGGAALTIGSTGAASTVSLTGTGSTYNGGTTVDNGMTLAINNNNALGTGDLSLTVGTTLKLLANMPSASPLLTPIALAGDGTIDSNGKTVYLTGGITGAKALTVQSSAAGGVLGIGGANAPASTAISSGTLALADASSTLSGSIAIAAGANYDISNGAASQTISDALSGSGSLLIGPCNLSIDTAIGDMNFAGIIRDTAGLNAATGGQLTKTGTNNLALSGASTYSGGTTLKAGTVILGANTAAGTGAIGYDGGTLQLGAEGVAVANAITLKSGAVNTFDLGGYNGTLSGAISGGDGTSTLALTSATAARLTLTQNNAYVGSTSIGDKVTLALSGNGTYGGINPTFANDTSTLELSAITPTTFTMNDLSSAAGTIALGTKNLSLGGAVGGTFGGVIEGTGAVSKQGTGTTTLTGTNTYSGGTTLSGGLVNFAAAANLGSGSVAFNGGGLQWATGNITDVSNKFLALGATGGSVDINGNNVTFASALTGTGGLTVTNTAGASTLTLTGANLYTGTTTVKGGTLKIGNGGTTGQVIGDIALENSSDLIINRSDPITYPGSVTGAGNITLAGPGDLTFTSTGSSITGNVNINAGTLTFAQSGNFSATNFTIASGAKTHINAGATLNLDSLDQTDGRLSVALGGTIDGTTPSALINVAGVANVGGILEITGFTTGGQTAFKASDLSTTQYPIITAGSISGSVPAFSAATATDYVLISAYTDPTEFGVQLALAWTSTDPAAQIGDFTLANSTDMFNVDIPLTNQTGVTSSWNGKTLTKKGLGSLTLSASNSYDGGTLIENGILKVATNDNLGATAGTLTLGDSVANTQGILQLSASNFNTARSLIFAGSAGGAIDTNGNNGASFDTTSWASSNNIPLEIKNSSATPTVLNLIGINTNYAGIITISKDELKINATLPNAKVTVASGARLSGNATLDSADIRGVVAPGNSIGSQTYSTIDYSNGGTYECEVSDVNGSADHITVTGTATLGGTSKLTVIPIPGNYQQGQTYTYEILSANAISGSGQFTTFINEYNALFDIQPDYSISNKIFLSLKKVASLSNLAPDGNAGEVADNLDNTDNPTGTLADAIKEVSKLKQPALNDALNRLGNAANGAIQDVSAAQAMDQLQSVLDMLHNPLEHSAPKETFIHLVNSVRAPVSKTVVSLAKRSANVSTFSKTQAQQDKQPPVLESLRARAGQTTVWMNGSGQSFTQKPYVRTGTYVPEVSSVLASNLIGIDQQATDTVLIGLMAGYGHNKYKLSSGYGSGRIGSYQVGVYGSYKPTLNWYINGIVAYGFNDLKGTRIIQFPKFLANANQKHHADQVGGTFDSGYDILLPSKVIVTPMVSVGGLYMKESAYTEKGAGTVGLKVRGQTRRYVQSKVGGQIAKLIMDGETQFYSYVRTLYTYRRSFDNSDRVTSAFIGGSSSFTLISGNVPNHLFSTGVGMTALFNNNVYVSVGYNGDFGANQRSHEGFLKVGFKF